MESNTSIIIDGLMKGAVALLGVVAGYYFAKDKYIFQKTYDRKLDLITDLYQQVVRLEFELKRYVHFEGAEMEQDSIDKKRGALNKIKNDFQQFQHKFWEVEIILDEGTIGKIQSFLSQYIAITSKLTVANMQQQGQVCDAFDRWDESFSLVSSELTQVKNELKKEFRKTLKK
ncbi:MAG: hypothetical protein AB1352_00520 [Patescibacteria group bacterium]